MKLDHNNETVEIKGRNLNSGTMGIKITSKLFSMMVDGLYQNKYGAVIRELATNALDAHDKIGKSNIPFNLTLPNGIVNRFAIRDFGPGLDKENMIKYFCTLLESDKDNSNIARGAFGVGCKSPFAVTDEFTVTSWHNGIKTVLLIARENKGTPTYYVLSETPSDEENGVMIQFESDEYERWKKETIRQLAAFKVKPTCNIDIEWNNITQLIDNELYVIENFGKTNYIEMGEVLYPLNVSTDINKYFPTNYGNKDALVLRVNIGDIMVPPDRERIDATDESIILINNLLNQHYTTLQKQYLEEFNLIYNNTITSLENFISSKKYIASSRYYELHSGLKDKFEKYTLSDFYKQPKSNVLGILGSPMNMFVCRSINKCNQTNQYISNTYCYSISDLLKNKSTLVFSNNARVLDVSDYCKKNNLENVIFIKAKLNDIKKIKEYLNEFKQFYENDVDFIDLSITKNDKSKLKYIRPVINKSETLGIYTFNRYSCLQVTTELYEQIISGKKEVVLYKRVNNMHHHNNNEKLNMICSENNKLLIIISEHKYEKLMKMKLKNVINVHDFIEELKNKTDYILDQFIFEKNFYRYMQATDYNLASSYLSKNKKLISNYIITKLVNRDKIYISDIINELNIGYMKKFNNAIFSEMQVNKQDLSNIVDKFVNSIY